MERETEGEKHRSVVPFMHAFISRFLHASQPGIEPTTPEDQDDAQAPWSGLDPIHILPPSYQEGP